MSSAYDDAVGALYRAPLEAFVAERKRLAAELKAAGDGEGAARLAKMARPTTSAWAVNQLFWHERRAFDELFAAAERLRDGEVGADATTAHRDAIANLRARAATLLGDAGKSASEETLRRVAGTLSALAAAGGFDSDPPGALQRDREPLGFDVPGLMPAAPAKRVSEGSAGKREASGEKRRQEAEAAEERRRVERERARKKAERERIEQKLRGARSDLEARNDEVARLERSLAGAADAVKRSQATVRDLETRLAELDADEDGS